ncbi:hypothetical protein QBC34DRAFT_128743 [Podospora aff. communis PSN243]|uniref:Uncharacterized protein n=1 Tax=Podospora aff. communis PSN243 TaxID=3040156 RepID=A0AAV9GJA5_9PEZI|nr:hypothetical protein QBC34DRAFT_128743 [Podospora aff. communis PSN243]
MKVLFGMEAEAHWPGGSLLKCAPEAGTNERRWARMTKQPRRRSSARGTPVGLASCQDGSDSWGGRWESVSGSGRSYIRGRNAVFRFIEVVCRLKCNRGLRAGAFAPLICPSFQVGPFSPQTLQPRCAGKDQASDGPLLLFLPCFCITRHDGFCFSKETGTTSTICLRAAGYPRAHCSCLLRDIHLSGEAASGRTSSGSCLLMGAERHSQSCSSKALFPLRFDSVPLGEAPLSAEYSR